VAVLRGLFGLVIRLRGSTLRSSAMMGSCGVALCPPYFSGRPPPPAASRRAGARAKPAKPGCRALARRTLAAVAGDAACPHFFQSRIGLCPGRAWGLSESETSVAIKRGYFGRPRTEVGPTCKGDVSGTPCTKPELLTSTD
jgi:hypothetical protein